MKRVIMCTKFNFSRIKGSWVIIIWMLNFWTGGGAIEVVLETPKLVRSLFMAITTSVPHFIIFLCSLLCLNIFESAILHVNKSHHNFLKVFAFYNERVCQIPSESSLVWRKQHVFSAYISQWSPECLMHDFIFRQCYKISYNMWIIYHSNLDLHWSNVSAK